MLRRLLLFTVLASLLTGCTLAERVLGGGSSPSDYVSAKEYPNLLVEIDHPVGYAPTPHAVEVLRTTLQQVTAKAKIDVRLEPGVTAEPDRKHTDSEIRALHERYQTAKTGGDTAVLHVLFLAGGHSADTGDSRVLGLASPGGSITILKGNIRASSSSGFFGIGGIKEENIERAVLVHEFGHAAGLVNLGAPMQQNHEDASHKGHSSNRNSVMYWAVETTGGLRELLDGGSSIPYQFDEQDKADLRALR